MISTLFEAVAFAVHIFDVCLYSVQADKEGFRNFFIGFAFSHKI